MQTMVIEHDYFCKDYRDTYTNLYAKKFAAASKTIHPIFTQPKGGA